jgi:hypothetical protein
MTERTSGSLWTARLWLIASLLFLLSAWQQPAKRAVWLALAVVFGIFAARARGGGSNGPGFPQEK